MNSKPNPIPFAQADKKFNLARFGPFDAGFENVYVHEGDLIFETETTGGKIINAFFPYDESISYHGLYIITGDLKVNGILNLDMDLSFSAGFLVMGRFTAKALFMDMTMFFVFGEALVSHLIYFNSVSGTLSIKGLTECPLTVVDDGDYNLISTGEILHGRTSGMAEDKSKYTSDRPNEWPFSVPTMYSADAKEGLAEGVWDNGFDRWPAIAKIEVGLSLLKEGYKSATRVGK